MKRTFDSQNFNTILTQDEEPQTKVVLVENALEPGGVSLVNPRSVTRKQYTDLMQLSDGVSNVSTAIRTTAQNRLDVIGRQMKNLHELMLEIYDETQQNIELHNVACNFVKKPGNTYHLYKRPSGQKYFGMLSPDEWQAPHLYLGSFKLEADLSWTRVQKTHCQKYEGLRYLREMFNNSGNHSELENIFM